MMMVYSNIHYTVIFAWITKFIVKSFSPVLPWTSCNHTWNTENCVDSVFFQKNSSAVAQFNLSFEPDFNLSSVNFNKTNRLVSASEEFLKYE